MGGSVEVSVERLAGVEARIRCAVAATLLSWLVHGDAEAQAIVTHHIGSTELLVDTLRKFAVFQERCGVLTDASLVHLHAAMLSIVTHGDNATPLASMA